MKKYFVIILSFSLFYSCITNKNVTFLQTQDELKVDPVKDSVLRQHDLIRTNYHLKVSDIIYIKIKSLTPENYNPFSLGVKNMQGGQINKSVFGYVIDSDGMISIPIIGELKASGKTLEELEQIVEDLTKDYLKEPSVRVSLLSYSCSILSEGELNFIEVSDVNTTIVEVLAKAQVSNEYVDWSKVKIIRQLEDSAEVFYLNLLDENVLASKHYYVLPDDIIVLSPLRKRTFMKYFSRNLGQITAVASSVMSFIALSVTISNMGDRK